MRTLDLNEAARFLRLHPHTLEAKARAGEVPGAKPGKCWVFLDVDLAEWLRAQYRAPKQQMEEACRFIGGETSGGANGASKNSARVRLGKLLAHPTARPRRNITTAAVLNFGDKRSSAKRP